MTLERHHQKEVAYAGEAGDSDVVVQSACYQHELQRCDEYIRQISHVAIKAVHVVGN